MKRLSFILLALLAFGPMAWAQQTPVNYILHGWNNGELTTTSQIVTDYTEISGNNSSTDMELHSGWYVVSGNDVARRLITIRGKAHLIICDDAKLNCTMLVLDTFNIYGQSDNTGVINASPYYVKTDNDHYKEYAPIGGTYTDPMRTLIIHGGTINAVVPAANAENHYCAGIGSGVVNDPHFPDDNGSVIVYGGTVTARGAKYCAGIGGAKLGRGGTLTVYGGTIRAYGGKYGAGIGGGQDGDGATVTVWGGDIFADGGLDAAGIGSGEETVLLVNHAGGKLTVHGGHVFADGTGWGAGIGGGEDADGAEVVIDGGIVEAYAGSDAGNKNGCAIGSENGDGHRGSLRIGDAMMVHAGQNPTDANSHLFPKETRGAACFFRPYARIEPCNHQGATYTINGTDINGTHTLHCKHCKANITEPHTFDGTGCSVCHVNNDGIKVVTIYLPVINADSNYTDGNYGEPITYYLAKGTEYLLPAAPLANEPLGMKFAGWRNGSPTGNTFIAGANEELIAADWLYNINDNLTLTARYHKITLFNTSGNWNENANWYWGEIPGANDTVVIAAEATIPSGYTAQGGDRISLDLSGTITIKDGGQFINDVGVWGTVEKNIAGHEGSAENGWYFIASPMMDNVKPSAGNGFITEDSTKYDLYYYEEPTHYWRNYKQGANSLHPHFSIEPRKGYLYANREGTTLKMTGTISPGDESITLNNLSHEASELTGWNLVGNPFACKATIDKPCYTLTGNAINTTANAANTYQIAPSEAVMVQADATSESVTFTRVMPATQSNQPNNGSLQIVLSQVVEPNSHFASLRGTKQSSGSGTLALDNTIVSFKEGERLEKFVFNADLAKLYIPQDGKDYAITNAERQGEMPLNFEAMENGEYTIAVNPENMEMGYLHLVDNLTGADVDLLASPSYTFSSKTTDYASRFKLVFSTNGEDGPSTGSGTFAFIDASGNIIVNGEGVLQVVDVMGRIIISINFARNVSTSGMTPGVYVLRLIDENDVRTQKIVIK